MSLLKPGRLIPTPLPLPGTLLMAADDFLAKQSPGRYAAIVRFYRWRPPAVSLGRFQPDDVVDLDACRAHGWDVVRRPTGGRALLHRGDLSYSLILPASGARLETLKRIHAGIAEAMTAVFAGFGWGATGIGEPPQPVKPTPGSPDRLCLNTRVRGEVLLGGRKVAAAAQRLYHDTVLQHGSIMVSCDAAAITQVARLEEGERERLAEGLRRRAWSLEDAVGGEVDVIHLQEALAEAFATRFGLSLEKEPLSPVEERMISDLAEEFAVSYAPQSMGITPVG